MVCITFRLPHTSFHRLHSSPKRCRFDVSRLKPSPALSAAERDVVLARIESFQDSVASALRSTPVTADVPQQGSSAGVEERWCVIRDALVHAGHQHLGFACRCQPDWFTSSQEVLAPLFRDRRLAYNAWVASQSPNDHAKFKAARSKARAATRRAKNDWLADIAQQAESGRVACHGGSVWLTIHSIQRCFRGLRPIPATSLKNEDGQPCSSAEELSARWQRHFTKVLNIESAYDESVFDSLRVRPVCSELAELPTKEELVRAISRLCNNKAPGESGILPEMVRYAGAEFLEALLSLVHEVWRESCVPQAWRNAELVPIPKKGDLSVCDNWRGIALLDVVGKVVGRLIQNRLQGLAEVGLTDSQCGF